MSEERDRWPAGKTAMVSLVALVASAVVSDAVAALPAAHSSAPDQELSARVAAVVERIRLGDPTLVPALRPETKFAQWRNF
jgi:hypothetical protein